MHVQEKAMEAANTGGGAPNIDDDKVTSACSFPEDSSYAEGKNPIWYPAFISVMLLFISKYIYMAANCNL